MECPVSSYQSPAPQLSVAETADLKLKTDNSLRDYRFYEVAGGVYVDTVEDCSEVSEEWRGLLPGTGAGIRRLPGWLRSICSARRLPYRLWL